jgi:polyvinyl alcohol dehydrogenase (cytochrome)
MRWILSAALIFLAFQSRAIAQSKDETGDPFAAEVYTEHCAQCHDRGADARVPPRATLEKLSPAAVLRALETGVMREMGAKLTQTERMAVAALLGKAESTAVNQLINRCTMPQALPKSTTAPAWSGWSPGLSNWRFQDAARAKLSAADIPNLKLKWAFAVPDATSMRSQPAVYASRVFLAGPGAVYSLDAVTGCVFWATEAAAPIRSGLTVAPLPQKTLVIFGDDTGYLRALDASTGALVWQLHAEENPAAVVTSTPAFYNGRLYVGVSSTEEGRAITAGYVCCSFRGSVQALDAATGKVLWKTYTIADAAEPGKPTKRGAKTMGPSGAGVWSTPTLDPERNMLYVTTGDNYSDPTTGTSDAVLAVALDSGRILWSKQFTEGDASNSTCGQPDKANCPDADGPDFDFGSSAILVRLNENRRVLVLPQKSAILHGIDPDQQGKILWQARLGQGGMLGGIQWGAATDGNRIYVALSDMGFTARTAMGRNPDPHRGGGMFAFLAENGERIWMTAPASCGNRAPCSPAQSQAVSVVPGAVFSGSNDGHLRAYATADGKVIWDYDTVHNYQTVNGVAGRGGALDAGGPVIAGGMVFVRSGYGRWGGMPGNVLLAFAVE